jgi:hypothetical protein
MYFYTSPPEDLKYPHLRAEAAPGRAIPNQLPTYKVGGLLIGV